jgi:hypothetical protein
MTDKPIDPSRVPQLEVPSMLAAEADTPLPPVQPVSPVAPLTPQDLPQEAVELFRKATEVAPNPLATQVGGNHYKLMAIQPIVFAIANNLGFIEGSVIKYVARWPYKGGIEDLKKARDMLDKKIAAEEAKAAARGSYADYIIASIKAGT